MLEDLPTKYIKQTHIGIKPMLAAANKAEDKRRLKETISDVELVWQIDGFDIPNYTSEEYYCQAIMFLNIELNNIKSAEFVGNILQKAIKELCIINFYDKKNSALCFALKRLNKLDKTEVVLEDLYLQTQVVTKSTIGKAIQERDKGEEIRDKGNVLANESHSLNRHCAAGFASSPFSHYVTASPQSGAASEYFKEDPPPKQSFGAAAKDGGVQASDRRSASRRGGLHSKTEGADCVAIGDRGIFFNSILNQTNKQVFYIELLVRTFLALNPKLYKKQDEILNSKIWYKPQLMLDLYQKLTLLKKLKLKASKTVEIAERSRLNGQIKELIKTLENLSMS